MGTTSGHPAPTAELVVDAHAQLGEGPVWDLRSNRLLWTDILGNRVHQFDPSSGQDRVVVVNQPVGAIALRDGGGHVVAARDGFAVLDVDTGQLDSLVDVEKSLAQNRMNDGKCDPGGRFWAGTMDNDAAPGQGTLYRLDTDHRVTRVLEDVTISNGLAWTADSSTMYYIDSAQERIDAFAFDLASARIEWARTVVAFQPADGRPDGMTIDAEGFLWVAMAGGWAIRRYDPTGRLDRTVHVPARLVTSCTFGGTDLADLYITTAGYDVHGSDPIQPHAGGVFRYRPGVGGVPPEPFRG